MKIVLDTHAHTIVSGHAYNTIREMAQMAKEKGLEAFALTEHAPQMPGTCHEFYFQNLHIVPREMYGVRLFMGVELNIMNEKGEVDLPESTLCQMDIAIASIHGPCYKGERTEEAITAAYLAAMENPLIHIIGHPDDGRYEVDYEALVQGAKEYGKILELNNHSMDHVREITLSGLQHLERALFLCHIFGIKGSFCVRDCPVLSSLRIGDGAFVSYVSCVIESNAMLKEIVIGELYDYDESFYSGELVVKGAMCWSVMRNRPAQTGDY